MKKKFDETAEGKGNLLYPVFLKAASLNILLVGGGAAALEKVENLLKNDPEIPLTIVASEIRAEKLRELKRDHKIRIKERPFKKKDLEGRDLVIVATGDRKLGAGIRKKCRKRHILVNVADTPDLCDFYMGSVVRKGDLKIAISTNGKSPTLAKRMREYFEEAIPEDIQSVLDNLKEVRDRMKGDLDAKIRELNQITANWLKQKSE